jgi:hypothetical protein
MMKKSGCLLELRNVKGIINSEQEKENTGRKLNATETTLEANRSSPFSLLSLAMRNLTKD